jgi:hypothetical protein|tara:strand:+ start:690 stop:926 length:237 start_codon:yes stop_codon:yes gene_type:complete
MATLKEIYNELETLYEEMNEYVDNAENANLASDVTGNALIPLSKVITAIDSIMDDEAAGVYEMYGEDDLYQEDEEFDC